MLHGGAGFRDLLVRVLNAEPWRLFFERRVRGRRDAMWCACQEQTQLRPGVGAAEAAVGGAPGGVLARADVPGAEVARLVHVDPHAVPRRQPPELPQLLRPVAVRLGVQEVREVYRPWPHLQAAAARSVAHSSAFKQWCAGGSWVAIGLDTASVPRLRCACICRLDAGSKTALHVGLLTQSSCDGSTVVIGTAVM